MKEAKRMNRDWNWANITGSAAMLLTLVMAGIGVFALLQDHSVKMYFMSGQGTQSGHNGYCIEGYRDWWPNEYGVFCSDDVNKSISVLNEMNASLIKLRGK